MAAPECHASWFRTSLTMQGCQRVGEQRVQLGCASALAQHRQGGGRVSCGVHATGTNGNGGFRGRLHERFPTDSPAKSGGSDFGKAALPDPHLNSVGEKRTGVAHRHVQARRLAENAGARARHAEEPTIDASDTVVGSSIVTTK